MKSGQEKLQRTNDGIRKELNAFNAAKEGEKRGTRGKMMNSGANSTKEGKSERLKKENEARTRKKDDEQQSIIERNIQERAQARNEIMQKTAESSPVIPSDSGEGNTNLINEEPITKEEIRELSPKGILKRLFGIK